MAADIDRNISISKDPLTYVLHPIATLGMVSYNESFDYLPISSTCQPLLAVSFLGNWYFPAFKPASEIDVQSLLRGLCCQPNNRADGISPPR